MTKRDRSGSPAARLRATKGADELWEEEQVAVTVSPSPTEVVSFRISGTGLDALVEAAEEVGETMSEYVRKAISLRLHGSLLAPAIDATVAATHSVLRRGVSAGSRSENDSSQISPDFPPHLVALGSDAE